ncbi:hypothetical protein PoB_000185300 [Plakobranchus ocellatus]|uniref:PiggyBac transposable element-derived protein domain-containing protein n=1 Tax=Plakobranchus ocellatus TaxID=259542 RepID=A0AAV3XYB4_9GAST|nr:hypothetical protein PoB_000185300 [Plakobranchus ocellatus]
MALRFSAVVFTSILAISGAFVLFDDVTWGPNPLSSSYFVTQPRTTAEAISQGFTKISDCDVNAKWRGARYVKDGDYALTLLFDVNGFIAGIQTSVPKTPGKYPKAPLQPPFVDDGDRWVVSAYFTEPSKICTTGRSATEFSQHGTGTDLYLQNSTKPEDSFMVPHKESGIGATKWTEGRCFYTMGKHYWYNLSLGMSCDAMFPVFLLYNGGELNAFGWAMVENLASKHFEHPAQSTYGMNSDSEIKDLLSDVNPNESDFLTSGDEYQPSAESDSNESDNGKPTKTPQKGNRHCTKEKPQANNRVWKIQPWLNSLRNNLGKLCPTERQSVDEVMVAFKGRCKVKQYIRNKPHKWGINVWARCSKDGVLHQFEVYQGAKSAPSNAKLSITYEIALLYRLSHFNLTGYGME